MADAAPTDAAVADATSEAQFPLELQLWLSPSFPVGSFAFSHGLEWAAARGRVRDRPTAEAWLTDLIGQGAARNDAILLAEAWRAARSRDAARLAAANALALALAGGRERHLETSAQGNAFMATVRAAWADPGIDWMAGALDGDIAYPIGVGGATGVRGICLAPALQAFVAANAANLVSALVRLAVIGQTDGQRVLAALAPAFLQLAGAAAASTLEDLGGAAFVSDIAALAHETEETRMFRT